MRVTSSYEDLFLVVVVVVVQPMTDQKCGSGNQEVLHQVFWKSVKPNRPLPYVGHRTRFWSS